MKPADPRFEVLWSAKIYRSGLKPVATENLIQSDGLAASGPRISVYDALTIPLPSF
jgi:hypothetical protein